MSIRYIHTNYNKLDSSNLLRFLLDTIGIELSIIKVYIEGNSYSKGDYIYLKENGVHKIFCCIVEKSSTTFKPDEWEHAMDIYDKEIGNLGNVNIREEVIIVDKDNINNIVIPNYKPGSIVTIFIGKDIYIQGKDFDIDENGKVTFYPHVKIEPGDKIIIDIKEVIGTVIKSDLALNNNKGDKYEISIIRGEMYIILSNVKYAKPELFIRDKVTNENYRIYMIDEDVCFDVIDSYINTTEIYAIDENENKYMLEMIDGDLVFSAVDDIIDDDNTGGDDNEGDDNTGGDDNEGDDNTGGDDNEGDDNTGGDNEGGEGGDDNTGGDDNEGDDNTGGDNEGGEGGDDNTGGDNEGGEGGDDNTGGDDNEGDDDDITITNKLTISSNDGKNYEIGIIDGVMLILETEDQTSNPEIFVRDEITDISYKFFMVENKLYFKPTDQYADNIELETIDNKSNQYVLKILNGDLYFSPKNN